MPRAKTILTVSAATIAVAALFVVQSLAPVSAEPVESRLASADPFAALVGERRDRRSEKKHTPDVERYSVSTDGRVFLLQGGVGEARIKFLCSPDDPRLDCSIDSETPAEEIFLITGVRGPRGDVIYRSREGEVLLRINSYGGATVFWPGNPRGQAASRSFGDDLALQLPEVDQDDARRRAQNATAHLSALTGAPIVFETGVEAQDIAPDVAAAPTAFAAAEVSAPALSDAADFVEPAAPLETNAAVLADAVARAASGMNEVAADPTGARILGVRVKRVRFVAGDKAALNLDGDVLSIVYDPEGGLNGRPSSTAVRRFLEESL